MKATRRAWIDSVAGGDAAYYDDVVELAECPYCGGEYQIVRHNRILAEHRMGETHFRCDGSSLRFTVVDGQIVWNDEELDGYGTEDSLTGEEQ